MNKYVCCKEHREHSINCVNLLEYTKIKHKNKVLLHAINNCDNKIQYALLEDDPNWDEIMNVSKLLRAALIYGESK